jgi:hypothetical protein
MICTLSSVLHSCGLFSEAFLFVHIGCWGLHSRGTSERGMYCACTHHPSTLKTPNFHNGFFYFVSVERMKVLVAIPRLPKHVSYCKKFWDFAGADVQQRGYPPQLLSGWRLSVSSSTFRTVYNSPHLDNLKPLVRDIGFYICVCS